MLKHTFFNILGLSVFNPILETHFLQNSRLICFHPYSGDTLSTIFSVYLFQSLFLRHIIFSIRGLSVSTPILETHFLRYSRLICFQPYSGDTFSSKFPLDLFPAVFWRHIFFKIPAWSVSNPVLETHYLQYSRFICFNLCSWDTLSSAFAVYLFPTLFLRHIFFDIPAWSVSISILETHYL